MIYFPLFDITLGSGFDVVNHCPTNCFDRVKEMISFFSKTVAKRTPPGQRQSVQNEGIR